MEKSSRKSRRGTFLAAAGRLITSHNSRGLPRLLLFPPLFFSVVPQLLYRRQYAQRTGGGRRGKERDGATFFCARENPVAQAPFYLNS